MGCKRNTRKSRMFPKCWPWIKRIAFYWDGKEVRKEEFHLGHKELEMHFTGASGNAQWAWTSQAESQVYS